MNSRSSVEIPNTISLPLVSIVIPAYNHATYLPESINSIMAQEYPNLQLIVIDDGSTDKTADVLAGLGPGFQWETQRNMGQSKTLERGWRMAQGEILGYLSADDVLEPYAVTMLVKALMADPESVAAYSNFCLIDPESRVVKTVNLPEFCYEKMLAEVSCPVGPGALFRRSAYTLAGPWNPRYKQMPDYDFWLRLGLHGKFIRLPQVLARFRVHDGSQTFSITTPERADEPIAIISGILGIISSKNDDPGLARCALANAYLVSGQLHLRAGRYKSGLDCLRMAFRRSARMIFSVYTFKLILNAMLNRTVHRIIWSVRGLVNGALR